MYFRSLYSFVLQGMYAVGVLFAVASPGYAQATFDFSGSPVLISGNDLQQGAMYRFSAVSAGTDALVEVSALNNATLIQLDSTTGVARAFQPEVDGDALGSYVEFAISFVDFGTANTTSVSGVFSALDVDAAVEFDTFFNVSDYTVETNGDLTLSVTAPQTLMVTGGGPGYAPTSEANTTVAVSITVNELPSFTYRVGVNGNTSRQTSLLFEPVAFNNAVFTNINDAPKAVADSNSLTQNSSLVVAAADGLLSNDSDFDTTVDTDVLTVDSMVVGVSTYGVSNSISLNEGELTVNSDGSYEFIPAANYSGSVPVVTYQVSDGKGGTSSSTLSLSVIANNTAPEAMPDSVLLSSYETLTINPLDNDVDDGNLDITSLIWAANLSNYPNGSSLSSNSKELSIAGEGVWSIAGNAVQFSPAVNSSGVVTPVRYSVNDNDGLGATALVTVIDGLASAPVTITINEDIDDNGFIAASEISGQIDVSAVLPVQAMVGDTVSIAFAQETRDVILDANHLLSGSVSAGFNAPVDGGLIQVRASLTDEAGNQSAVSRDQAVMDISATNAPVVSISADLDNSGFISAQENSDLFTVEVTLPNDASVNDKLTITSGTTAAEFILTPIDIANGSVSTTIPALPDGDALSVVAQLTDEAGNRSASGSDSAMIDISAPAEPVVNSLLSSSATPQITGTLPVDSNYLLSVQVNGVFYASGDGQLTESGDGGWSLAIPPSDALPDGVYDVNAVVTDMAGNSSGDVSAAELTVDLMMPVIVANNIGPSSDNAPVVGGSSDQEDGTRVLITTADGARVCEAVMIASQWSCASQILLPVGANALQATVSDIAGNRAIDAFTITVATATDTDGDGIADDMETTADYDNDGIANYLDLDSDNDTIADIFEGLIDRDGDGVRNYLDADSDNDGIADINEAIALNQAFDVQGRINDSSPVGSNGLADYVETSPDSGDSNPPVDTDGDLIPDFLDQDSDGDGISDVVENGHADIDADAMRTDGLLAEIKDFDQDNVPNYRDLDSDQDGISDIRELPASDVDGNGMVDNFIDADNNGVADNADGLPLGLSGGRAQDLDGDGSANFLDLDSDGDRKTDLSEAGGTDVDNNGVHDAYTDENNNRIPDSIDAQLTLGDDADNDLIDDLYDADFAAGADTDFDGIIDAFDADADGNGYADVLDDIAIQLPDQNGDGQADIFEAITPETAALLRTGVGSLGGGCAIQPVRLLQSSGPIDFLFLWLLLAAVVGIHRERLMLNRVPVKGINH